MSASRQNGESFFFIHTCKFTQNLDFLLFLLLLFFCAAHFRVVFVQATSQYMHIQNIASFFPFIYFYLFVYSFAFFIMLNTVDFFPSRLPSLICKQRKKVAQVKVMYSYVGSTNVHITHQNRPPSKMPTFFFAVVIKDRLNINFNI